MTIALGRRTCGRAARRILELRPARRTGEGRPPRRPGVGRRRRCTADGSVRDPRPAASTRRSTHGTGCTLGVGDRRATSRSGLAVRGGARAARASTSTGPSATRPDWAAGTGRSATSGGYTENVEPAEPVSQGGCDRRTATLGISPRRWTRRRSPRRSRRTRRRGRRRSSGWCAITTPAAGCCWLDYEALRAAGAARRSRGSADEAAEPLARRARWRSTIAPAASAIGEASVVDRRGVAAPRRGVRRVPLRDRAGQADRADLEARALRRRRRLDRRGDGGSGRRGGAAQRRWSARARDDPALRAAARAGRPRRADAQVLPDGATARDAWDALVARVPGAGATTRTSISARSTRTTRG